MRDKSLNLEAMNVKQKLGLPNLSEVFTRSTCSPARSVGGSVVRWFPVAGNVGQPTMCDIKSHRIK